MESPVVTIILAVLASSGIWSVILAIINHRNKIKDEARAADSAERQMLLALAHDRIYYLCETIIKEEQAGLRHGVTREEWENLDILYQGYHRLGGNGTCQRLYEEIKKLPITQ